MNSVETDSHSFIIKVWRETSSGETEEVICRGHVTHVISGERRYVKNIDEIVAFIQIYLRDMGVQLQPGSLFKRVARRVRNALK